MEHIPVMIEEVLKYLAPGEGKVIMDLNLGPGGHAREILQRFRDIFLIGVDLDEDALESAEENLMEFPNKILIRENFKNIPAIMEKAGVEKVDGILSDLGLSSLQLSDPEKGFSYRGGPLKMKFDGRQKEDAKYLINRLGEKELADLIYKYSQERFSRRIASGIARERQKGEIVDTKQLSDIIIHSIPPRARHRKIHAATRTFMALRLAVNKEMENLEEMLPCAWDRLASGGRLVIISYHSMEDSLVKKFMKSRARRKKDIFDEGRDMSILTSSPIRPEREEISRNPRSRSARLRAAEKISGGG